MSLNKTQIGLPITLKRLPNFREIFAVMTETVPQTTRYIIGWYASIQYTGLPPDDQDAEGDLDAIITEHIPVYSGTGLFLDHTGTRVFYIDVNLHLQEFDITTRQSIPPAGYDDIVIVDGDNPLMMLEDGSMLISVNSFDFLMIITATTRGDQETLNVDGVQAENIFSLNYIGDKVSISYGLGTRYGVVILDGLLPTSITSERIVEPVPEPTSFTNQNITSIVKDETILAVQQAIPDRPSLYFDMYDNIVGGDLIYRTNNAPVAAGTSGITGRGSLFAENEVTPKLIGTLESIFVSPEIVDFLPSDAEGQYDDIWTAGYRVISITTDANSAGALDILSTVSGKAVFELEGDFYNVQSIEEIDTRESLITLIHRQTT